MLSNLTNFYFTGCLRYVLVIFKMSYNFGAAVMLNILGTLSTSAQLKVGSAILAGAIPRS
jgi:hypothetical protein